MERFLNFLEFNGFLKKCTTRVLEWYWVTLPILKMIGGLAKDFRRYRSKICFELLKIVEKLQELLLAKAKKSNREVALTLSLWSIHLLEANNR